MITINGLFKIGELLYNEANYGFKDPATDLHILSDDAEDYDQNYSSILTKHLSLKRYYKFLVWN